jgi:hypothetical protein
MIPLAPGALVFQESRVSRLNSTYTDAVNMARLLQNNYGYEVTFMADESSNMNMSMNISMDISMDSTSLQFPTYNNIFYQLRNILSHSKFGDEIVIYYTGHATRLTPASTLGYRNASPGTDYDAVNMPINHWMDDRDNVIIGLVRTFGKKGTKIVMIFDCYHDDTVCDLVYQYNYDQKTKTFTTTMLPGHLTDIITKPIRPLVIALTRCQDPGVNRGTNVSDYENLETWGVLTSSFIHTVVTNPRATADIFTVVRDMDHYTSKYNQHPKITSNINIADPGNGHGRSIFNGASYLGPIIISAREQKPLIQLLPTIPGPGLLGPGQNLPARSRVKASSAPTINSGTNPFKQYPVTINIPHNKVGNYKSLNIEKFIM